MRYSVYGTVYNSLGTVEASIRSVFRPEYEIVITDSFSTDGTYEKLLELRKDFNLKVLRLKSSRGLGRDYALRHCADGSLTAYFDLDAVYNQNFHTIMQAQLDNAFASSIGQQTLYAKKERILGVGGWKDLNVKERQELVARIRPTSSIPVVIGYNSAVDGGYNLREKRYDRGITYYSRMVRDELDFVRGGGLNFLEVSLLRRKALYPLAKAMGVYRHHPKYNNFRIEMITRFERLVDPAWLGVDPSTVIIEGYEPLYDVMASPDGAVKRVFGEALKFRYGKRVAYARTDEGAKKFIDQKRFLFCGKI
jgi:glycosyltransferase involved in cell wall biosynthesis